MIIPRPAETHRRPGRFTVPAALHLSAGPGAQRAAELLAGYLGPDRTRTEDGPVIRLSLSDNGGDDNGDGAEGYRLSVDTDQVTLTASAEAGLRHGVQSLRQLLPPAALDPATAPPDAWHWPNVTITDAPRLPWRGVLLDVARHFLPLEFLYRFVDQLALHKLSVLQLHLTDDQGWRIEIDGWPRLTGIGAWRAGTVIGHPGSTRDDGIRHGGYYTQAELRDLARYAAERGVTIVPEIDLPGHVRAALAAYPELGNDPARPRPVWTRFGISKDILNVRDETLDFCRGVLDQVVGVFPSTYVHVGGDECPTVQWAAAPDALARAASLGLPDTDALRGWFARQLHDFLASRGRRTACWSDAAEFGTLPPEALVMAWRDAAHGRGPAERGHPVVMAPHLRTYFDYPQRDHPDEPLGQPKHVLPLSDVYDYDPLAGLPAYNGHSGVLGTQAQLWTEYAATPEHVEYLAYPRLCAFAEIAWSGPRRDFPDFLDRLEPHELRLRSLGVRSAVFRPSAEILGR